MPLFASTARNTEQFFTAIAPDLEHWYYSAGALRPVDTAAWPNGFQLTFYTTEHARFDSAAGNTVNTLYTTHGHTERQWFLDDPDTFFLISAAQIPSYPDFRTLIGTKFVPSAGSSLTEDGTVVLQSGGNTSTASAREHGWVYSPGVAGGTIPWHPIALDTFNSYYNPRTYTPIGPTTMIDGSLALRRHMMFDTQRRHLGMTKRLFTDLGTSGTNAYNCGVDEFTYVDGVGDEQRFAHIWRQAYGDRAGFAPYDLYIPFDGVIASLDT